MSMRGIVGKCEGLVVVEGGRKTGMNHAGGLEDFKRYKITDNSASTGPVQRTSLHHLQ